MDCYSEMSETESTHNMKINSSQEDKVKTSTERKSSPNHLDQVQVHSNRNPVPNFNLSNHHHHNHNQDEMGRCHTLDELMKKWNEAVDNLQLDEEFQKEHQVSKSVKKPKE